MEPTNLSRPDEFVANEPRNRFITLLPHADFCVV